MKRQIIGSSVLIVVGAVLGFFVVVNWQLAQAISNTEVALAQDSQKLNAIEKYLNDAFPPTDKSKE